jgi:hypothetical protein
MSEEGSRDHVDAFTAHRELMRQARPEHRRAALARHQAQVELIEAAEQTRRTRRTLEVRQAELQQSVTGGNAGERQAALTTLTASDEQFSQIETDAYQARRRQEELRCSIELLTEEVLSARYLMQSLAGFTTRSE